MKNFLEKNKIFFDTLGSFALGVIAILISIQAMNVALESRNLSKERAELTKKLNRPIIEVGMDPIFADNLNIVASNVTAKNNGAPIRGLEIAEYEFLDIECGKTGKGVWNKLLPIKGYYKYSFSTSNPTGDIAKFVPEDNFHKMGDLYTLALDAGDSTEGYTHPFFKSVIHLSFETAYGEKQNLYYDATPHGDGHELDEESALKFVNAHNEISKRFDSVPWFTQVAVSKLREVCGHGT